MKYCEKRKVFSLAVKDARVGHIRLTCSKHTRRLASEGGFRSGQQGGVSVTTRSGPVPVLHGQKRGPVPEESKTGREGT